MLFRRTDKYGYSRYYGGGGPLWILRIIVTLLVILALVVGGVTWSLQKYMVYTAQGGHLELPWSKGDESAEPDLPDPNEDLIVDVPDSSQEGDTSQPGDVSQSGDTSEPGDVSQGGDASAPGDVSQTGDASTSGDESQPGDASTPAEGKPGLWQRFAAWFNGLFASKPAPVPDESQPVDGSQGGDVSQGDGSVSETDEPDAPVTAPLKGGLLIQHVSMGDFGSGHGKGVVNNHKGNGIMLFMKESGGKLNYNSKLDLARSMKTYSDTSTANKLEATLAGLKEEGLYALAYVNCFQDGKMENHEDLALHDEDGDAWYDGDRTWADPANEEYQDYIVGIVKDLAELGYDEVVLRNAAYPVKGSLDSIDEAQYDPAAFADTLNAFYAKLAEAVKDTDTLISVTVTQEVITSGSDAVTGQTLDGLRQLGGRLWVEADKDEAEDLSKALDQAGFPENALGVLTDRITADNSWCQMNVD